VAYVCPLSFRLHLITFKKLLEDVAPIWASSCPGIGAPEKLTPRSLLLLLMYMMEFEVTCELWHSNLGGQSRLFGEQDVSRGTQLLVCFPKSCDSRQEKAPQKNIYDYAALKGIVALVDGTHIPCRAMGACSFAAASPAFLF